MEIDKANEILNNLEKIANQPYEKAKEWKERTGNKVVGVYPMHYPEELIHAAGILPVLLQTSDEAVTEGRSYYYPFFCALACSVIDQAAKGYLKFMDGVISGDYCIQVVGSGECVEVILPSAKHMFFRIPVGNQEGTVADILVALKELKREIESFTGKEIKVESIRKSIRIYNKNRSLIRKIYELKASNPGIINPKEMVNIIKSGMVMPKEEHNEIMDSLLPELAKRKAQKKERTHIFISGCLCAAPKFDIFTIFEQSGADIVGDDIFHGLRYVSTNINEEKDPLLAIAEHYLEKNKDVPCPTRVDTGSMSNWPQYVVDSMKKCGAEQLVILMWKYCEAHMFFYPEFKKLLEREKIPHLLIEMENEVTSFESLRTKIEAFVEMKKLKQCKK